MAKRLTSKNNFNAGELSPRLFGRQDTAKYANGLETATNSYVLPHGPILRRKGSTYISEVKFSSSTTRLLKFQFNSTDSFILEFGSVYIRFYTLSGQVQSSGAPYEIVSPYIASDVDGITYAQFGDLIYLAHPSYAPRVLKRTSTTDWSISTLDSLPPPTFEGGLAGTSTVTPGATSGTSVTFTAGAGFFQDADVGRQIVNEVGAGRASIIGYTSSTVVTCAIVENFPSTSAIASGDWKIDLSPVCYLTSTKFGFGSVTTLKAFSVEDGTSTTLPNAILTPGASGGTGVTFTADKGVFAAADVGKEIILEKAKGRARIVSRTSATVVVADITETLPGTADLPAGDWKLGLKIIDAFRGADVGRYIKMFGGVAQIISNNFETVEAEIVKSFNEDDVDLLTTNWSIQSPTWSASRGYPRSVSFFQDRLIFAGTSEQPQTIWMSEQGIYDGFGTGPDDEDAITATISSSEVNQIQWIAVGRDLIVGTSGGENTISASQPITPDNLQQTPRTYHGSNSQTPITVGSEVIFHQRSKRKIRTFRYDFNIDSYIGEDLNFLSEHITEPLVKEIAYAQEPDSMIYAVMEDGTMLAGTYEREQQVIGWTRFTTDGLYESVQTITVGDVDQVWVIVNRTIGGATKRYIELFSSADGTQPRHTFSDSSLVYSVPYTVTGITNANPAVITSVNSLSNGDVVKLVDVLGMDEINNNTYTVTEETGSVFQLLDSAGNTLDTTSFGTYTSGGKAHKLVSTVSGLSHLEGKTVQVKVDGATHVDRTVSGGAISLSNPSYEVTVGLRYTTTIKTIRPEFDSGLGGVQGQRIRNIRTVLRVHNSTLPLLNGEFKPSRNSADEMDYRVPLISGDIEYGSLPWGTTGQHSFSTSDPFPLIIHAIYTAVDGGVK